MLVKAKTTMMKQFVYDADIIMDDNFIKMLRKMVTDEIEGAINITLTFEKRTPDYYVAKANFNIVEEKQNA